MRNRITKILEALKAGAYERDEVIALSLLSALAGESIFLLGLPGVGKSMIARRLKLAFENATVFEYLMSRFSTPDEIFGPVSISKLKNEDCYERVIDGYLPSAEVVFLDEIWKAGPAIQNSLLTVLNEKIYLNGNCELPLPVKAIIAASNELPVEGEGLEALWDRFLIRYIVEPISEKANFFRLISDEDSGHTEIDFCPLSDTEYRKIRSQSHKITIPDEIMELIYNIRKEVNDLSVKPEDEETEENDREKYYVSDRRWKKITGILRTSAFLNGRPHVDMSDILLLEFMLWDNDAMLPVLRRVITEAMMGSLFTDVLKTFKTLTCQSKKKHNEEKYFASTDGKHYNILCDDFILKIRIIDYERMLADKNSYFFASETADNTLILKNQGQYSIQVARPGYVCINSYNYPLATDNNEETVDNLETAVASFTKRVTQLKTEIEHNIFTSRSRLYKDLNYLKDVYLKRLK